MMIPWKTLTLKQRGQVLWMFVFVKVCLSLSLVACSVASPTPTTQVDTQAVIACETIGHNLCAHCCEVQPYVDETKNGTLVTRPIEACSASPLPSSWTVAWCMSDCSTEVDNSCQPGAQ